MKQERRQSMLRFCLLVVLVSLLACACKDEKALTKKPKSQRNATSQQVARQEAADEKASAEMAVRLGDGYRNARWGTSAAEVKQALGGKVIEERAGTLMLETSERQGVTCFFQNDGLANVVLNPRLADRDSEGFYAIKTLLEEKFGKGEAVTNLVQDFGFGQLPLEVYQWEDETTVIQLRRTKPIGDLVNKGTSSTTKVTYKSKDATRAKARAEADQRAEQERQRLDDARKKMGGNL